MNEINMNINNPDKLMKWMNKNINMNNLDKWMKWILIWITWINEWNEYEYEYEYG